MQAKIKKILVFLLCFLFCFEQSGLAQVAAQLDIAGHLAGLRNAFAPDVFRPLHLRYLSYDPQANNFRLFLDKGSIKNPRPQEIEDTTKTLLHYFFIGLVLPNDKFWVNLKPDAEDNIIDTQLAQTDVGRVLLESDLQLKKDTARFTSPETPEGKEYWDKLYQKAGELFGSQNIIIPTLTRPWIMPDEIIIRETQDSAYIYKATLKVMLEQDYLKGSVAYNFKDERLKELNEYSSQLIRELIIPKLAKEINSSKRYAALRQVHYSLIMAQWFKARFANKDGLYSRIIDRGIIYPLLCSKESWSKTTYFKEYQKSFRDGEYKIQEPVYAPFGQTIRSYFSGGTDLNLGLQLPFGAAQEPQPQGVNILLDPAYRHPGPKSNETEQKIQATDVPGEVVIEFGRKDAATEENLPPYTGSGSTSIHKALQDARAMLDKGNFVQAKELLEELLKDLELAQKTGNIEALMSTWNERYPSDLPVDLLIADTPGAISEAQALLEQIEAPAGLPIQESVNSTKQEKGNFHTRLLNKLKIFLAALLAIAMIRSDTTITRNHHYQELTSTATIQAQGEHKNLLKVFSQFERWPGSKAHNSAARFIFTSLFDAGYFSQDADKGKPHVISNYVDGIGYCYIEGVLPGISKNARHIVVVAHFDSIGPGADDNASGVIGVLELAKRLIKGKSRDTVHFLFTGDEEFNKLGIRTFLRDMYLKGVTPENTIVINVDTIGYSHISGIGANLRPEIWLTPAYKSKDEGKHKLFPAIKLSPSPTNDSDEIVVAGEEAGMSDAGICALYGYPAVTISGITRKEAAELGIINTEYDNSSKINFEAMEKALSWLFKNLTRLSGWQYNPQSSKRKTASLEKPPAITEQEIDFSQQTQDLFRKNNLYFFSSSKSPPREITFNLLAQWLAYLQQRWPDYRRYFAGIANDFPGRNYAILNRYGPSLINYNFDINLQFLKSIYGYDPVFGVEFFTPEVIFMHEIAHIFLTSPSETLSKETGNILPPYYNLNELFCNDFTLMFLYDRVSTGTFVGTYFGKKEVDHVKLQGSIEARRQFILRLFEKIGVKPFVKAFPSRQLRLKEHILPLDKDKIDPPRQNGQMKPIGLRGPSFGGIDFRHFPIVIQAIGNLNANLGDPSFDRLSNINLDSEWRDIENLVNSGVIPSAERIKEYVRASCYKGAIDRDTDKVILCISEILRLEEERYLATESMLKDILVVIESVGYTQQLKTAFLGSGS